MIGMCVASSSLVSGPMTYSSSLSNRLFISFCNEGKIYFTPTYKYINNSDEYLGGMVTCKKKGRTPAWCDRILWHGDGIVQLSYFRGDWRFSDRRSVCATFLVEVVQCLIQNW